MGKSPDLIITNKFGLPEKGVKTLKEDELWSLLLNCQGDLSWSAFIFFIHHSFLTQQNMIKIDEYLIIKLSTFWVFLFSTWRCFARISWHRGNLAQEKLECRKWRYFYHPLDLPWKRQILHIQLHRKYEYNFDIDLSCFYSQKNWRPSQSYSSCFDPWNSIFSCNEWRYRAWYPECCLIIHFNPGTLRRWNFK